MPPKTPINPQRQAAILAWFHKTALAYSLKDLEKLIPSVTTVNSMGVKDYVQAMHDDGLIESEKIGSGNWYWSFPSAAKKKKEKALADAQAEHNKALSTTTELQEKVDQAGAARAEDAELLAETGHDRKTLTTKHETLAKEVDKLRTELASYSDYDPVELEKKIEDTQRLRAAADKFTEHIYCMEGWLKARVLERAAQIDILKQIYGDEWDDEDGGLREL